jgi:hypothetical protein
MRRAAGGIRHAPRVRAGRRVLATEHKGTAGFAAGMAPEVLDAVGEGYATARAVALTMPATIKAQCGDLDRVKRVLRLFGARAGHPRSAPRNRPTRRTQAS